MIIAQLDHDLTYNRLMIIAENGEYIGLDLGGTNFRVVRVIMKNGEATTTTKYYNLAEDLLSGPCQNVSPQHKHSFQYKS